MSNEIMVGAAHVSVDPAPCVYLTRVPKVVTCGVLRLKHLFVTISFRGGYDNAVIIEMTEELQGEQVPYFQFVGAAESKIMELIQGPFF